jgi:hypothetical protein
MTTQPLNSKKYISVLFKCLENSPGTRLPEHGYLSDSLSKLIVSSQKKGTNQLSIDRKIAACFATASVEMWQRGIHSFLISASLTNTSSLWSSVSGYYASHYCVRGLAHLFGYFHLHKKRSIVKIDIDRGKYYCIINDKPGPVREHKYYWKIVKEQPLFKDNPFFTINDESVDESDSGHRNIANYSDHLNRFPNFKPLDETELINRISFISKMQLSSVPIPQKNKYPDKDSVQLIAYHRLIIFRKLLDNILGGSNKFWSVHRKPPWCNAYINFQIVEPSFVDAYKGIV